MACFSTYISINIFTFLLLSRWPITTGNCNFVSHLRPKPKICPFPTQLVQEACKGTASFSSLEEACILTLTTLNNITSKSTGLELAKATLLLATEKAEDTMGLIGSPEKPCFKSCGENYKDAVVAGLRRAELWLEKGDVDQTDDELSLARDAVDYCNLLLTVNSDDQKSIVFAANKDVYNHITFAMSVIDLL